MRKFTFFRAWLCCIALVAVTQVTAQTGFPTCSKLPKCVSKDLEVVGAFLSATTCTCPAGGTIKATLNMKINNKTGSTRTSFAFFANLVQTDPATGDKTTSFITGCDGPVAPNSITTLSFPDEYEFICGRTLTLTNVYLAWTDASDNKSCPLAFCSIAPKCGFPQVDINIVPLLSATATTAAACEGESDGSITITATGGTAPYTYSRNGTTYQSSATFSGLASGNYTLYVKDAASTPCIFSFEKTLPSKVCCVTPTINDQPDAATKCAGASATFTVGSTGGVPTPTIQWQVSTDNGANYNNITNGSPYSGATTATLTVNPVTVAMNGYRYRAVLTSGNCPAATSNGAVLTVNGIPQAPPVTYNPPDCDETTFSVTVTGVTSGAVYTIKDKNGANISGVSPASPYTAPSASNFSFSNIPAGSGYQVSVSVASCPSATSNNCGVVTALRSNSVVEPLTSATTITKVKVAPNPYNDRIRFTVEASESGKGVLELYSIMGQKLKTVFEGHIDKGQLKTIEYNVPFTQRSMMVYVFRVGNQRATGKLISSR